MDVAPDGRMINITVSAMDPSGGQGISRVVVTYTTGHGTWASAALEQNGSGDWIGGVPTGVDAIVQALDFAGNVAADDNGGRYYQ